MNFPEGGHAEPGGFEAPAQAVFAGPFPATAPDLRGAIRAPLKRAIDVAIAVVALVVLGTVVLIAGGLIRAVYGGPVLYRHRRVGRGGVEFICLKLRTMHVDSDAILERHLADSTEACDEWGRTQKLQDDPRILGRLGRFLRRTSLDELPQLWNILRGDMSLVGPRPVVAAELEHYGSARPSYLAVRPGLTGVWQVSGRSNASYSRRVQLDVDYVRNPSLRRDLLIMLRTIPAVLFARGAC